MLEACAALLDEGSYTDLSTTRVAERAGVAIGSVYQFFPDKQAIARALAMTHTATLRARIAQHLETEQPAEWAATVDSVLDAYIEMHRAVPGFRTLHFGQDVDAGLLDVTEINHRVVIDQLAVALAAVTAAETELDRLLSVAMQATDAVLRLAFRHSRRGDCDLIAECRLLVRSYLAAHIPRPDPAKAAPDEATDPDESAICTGTAPETPTEPPELIRERDMVAATSPALDQRQEVPSAGTMDMAGLYPPACATTGE